MPLTNVIGIFNPEAKRKGCRLRPLGYAPSGRPGSCFGRRSRPIIGANDGASGVSVLELARNFKEQKPEIGVVMVFF